MQPYIVPYIGYFQLIQSVDTFVFYDDVNFITKGFIHRNAILAHGQKMLFSVPLAGASQNLAINNINLHEHQYAGWWRKFEKTITQSYCATPYYDQVMPLVQAIFRSPPRLIAALAERSVRLIAEFLNLEVTFKKSSQINYNTEAKTENKILDLCDILQARTYINPVGGVALYNNSSFVEKNIKLQFLKSKSDAYPQKSTSFEPSLSMIDVLMNNSKDETLKLLRQYKLIEHVNDELKQ